MSKYRRIYNERLAAALKALANPHRLAIFQKLIECCGASCDCSEEDLSACVGDLGAGLGIAPSTLSHHIKELRYAGLIDVDRRGREMHCTLGGEILTELLSFFQQLEVCRKVGTNCYINQNSIEDQE